MNSEPKGNLKAIGDKTNVSHDILIVDDEMSNLKLLAEYLVRAGYQVRPTESPLLAIDSALAKPPILILLDVRMPDLDGFEVCERLKRDERTRDVPIIFISALQDVRSRVRGFEAGGVDFISKPLQESEVVVRVRTHMDLRNMQLGLESMVAKRTAEVKENEQLFRATFEQAAVGIAHVSTLGKVGRFLRINKKFCDIVGYTKQEMLDLTFQDITHPDDLDADLDYVQQVLDREIETYSMDKRYYRKDGTIVWVTMTVSLVFEKEGHPKYFVSVVQDISERKQAEKSLSESHDFLKHLTAAVPDAIFSIKFPDRKILWANDSYNVLGYEDEEYIGQSVKPFYADPEHYYMVGRKQMEAIRRGDDMIRTEVLVRHKDGRAFPAEFSATFFREEGKLSRITALVRDITERKLFEENLAESEAKYRGLVDNSLVGVFNSTFDGQLLFVNDAMVRMFDFDNAASMMASGVLERWRNPDDRDRMLSELRAQGSVTSSEAELITQSGREIHVLFSAKQIGDNIIGMLMDVTDRKQAEQKIIDYQQRLKSLASRLTIAEEMERRIIAANLHDKVGQSLALARIQLSSVRKSTSDSKLADKLDDISDVLLECIKDTKQVLFDLSSPTMHKMGLASAISEWLEILIEGKHDLKTEFIDNLTNNRKNAMDPNWRTILFRNTKELVINVIKHARANKVSVRLEDRSSSIRIIVEDDGIGFDPRAVTQALGKTGSFGLFSVEELMSDLGGNLRIVSGPGKGCTAILSAPFIVNHSRGRD